ncbi:MAG: hypothetical protein WAW11_00070 [Patescibacteria group bacterium]
MDNQENVNNSEYLDEIRKKADGAVAEVVRQINRDQEVETSFSTELDGNTEFTEEAEEINQKRMKVSQNLLETNNFIISSFEPVAEKIAEPVINSAPIAEEYQSPIVVNENKPATGLINKLFRAIKSLFIR